MGNKKIENEKMEMVRLNEDKMENKKPEGERKSIWSACWELCSVCIPQCANMPGVPDNFDEQTLKNILVDIQTLNVKADLIPQLQKHTEALTKFYKEYVAIQEICKSDPPTETELNEKRNRMIVLFLEFSTEIIKIKSFVELAGVEAKGLFSELNRIQETALNKEVYEKKRK